MSEKVKAAVKVILEEALSLRQAIEVNFSSADEDLAEARQDIRRKIDRLEELLNVVVRIRYSYKRSVEKDQFELDEAWDRAVRDSKPKVAFGSDMIAPRERYADANLKTLEQHRKLNESKEVLSHVQEAEEVVRNCYKGLDGLRLELSSVIKSRSIPHASEY